MKFQIKDENSCARIGGPAIYAAAGMALMGNHPQISSVIGIDATELDEGLLKLIDPGMRFLSRSQLPTIKWVGSKLLGDLGRGELIGVPSRWIAYSEPGAFNGKPLILSNADPNWYANILHHNNPSFVAFDFYSEWLSIRAPSINQCLNKSSIITATEEEWRTLPRFALSGVRVGEKNGPALVLKRGRRGIAILADGERAELPPPDIDKARCDIGAGDLLIGAISAGVLSTPINQRAKIESIVDAYEASLPLLACLLESPSPDEFMRKAEKCLVTRKISAS